MATAPAALGAALWVVERCAGPGTMERLGDARRVADALGARVGVAFAEGDASQLIAHGADVIAAIKPVEVGPATFAAAVEETLRSQPVSLVYANHSPEGRALAA